MPWIRFTAMLFLVLCSARADAVDYLRDIKPLLAEKCYACHGTLKQEASLRLETLALMMESSVLDLDQPEHSLLIERVTAEDDSRMPPPDEGSALTAEEVELLQEWIAQGAQAPDEATPAAPQEHWAFQPIPASQFHSIDQIIGGRLASEGLEPAPAADRRTQLRRLYLDLIGLPPNAEQLDDQRELEQIVDELLSSPHHGERWARHWMDIWRYSDGYGLNKQLRYSQKHLWHWRDWIVQSLNDDKGYDQMVLEMLAGDELYPDDPSVLAATGFLARNYYLFNRTTWLDNTIEHTGKAFLGLTLNCAKCHDHKYDPISHVDYYQFRALFEPHQVRLDPVPGSGDFEQDGLPRVFDDDMDSPTHLHVRGDPTQPDEQTEIVPAVPALFASFQPAIEPTPLPRWAFDPGSRDYVDHQRLKDAAKATEKARQQVEAAEIALKSAKAAALVNPERPADFRFQETFAPESNDLERLENWTIVGRGWQLYQGDLIQNTPTREAEYARLDKDLPADFEVRCRYTTTGGTTYKSVTFRFDESEDRSYANYVYTSAHAPGPKVQVAYSRDGQSTYPPKARKSHPITVGQAYELRFAVRENLVNVWLDDQFMVAYYLPDRPDRNRLSLSGFDATVAFHVLEIRSLDPKTELVQPDGPAPLTASNAERKLEEARWQLQLAESSQTVVQLEAQRHALLREEAEFASIRAADRQVAVGQAQHALLDAKYQLFVAEKKGDTSAAKKQLQRAQATLAKAEAGESELKLVRAAKKALESPAHKEEDYAAVYPQVSSGRRTALARWIVSPRNPLTARVAVNHLWMRHFGQPLVESVDDFGLRAREPIHLDLLDFLARELIDSDWSLRHIHRLMVTSEVYRRSSRPQTAPSINSSLDPANQYYWRMNPRRMEAQVVRDSLLSLAGTLDRSIGGPSVDSNAASRRRSLYFKHSRDDQNQFLSMFDDADLLAMLSQVGKRRSAAGTSIVQQSTVL